MKSAPIVPDDKPLMDIRYKYISQKVPGVISIEESLSTEPEVPYLSCYPENYYNISISPISPLTFLEGILVPVMQ